MRTGWWHPVGTLRAEAVLRPVGKLRTTLAPDSVTQARPSCPPQPPLAALPTAPAVLPKHAHTLRPGARPPPRAWPEEVHGWGRIPTDCPLLREAFLGFRRTRHRPHSHLCTAADFCRPASPPAFLKPFSRGSFKIANQMKSASYSRPASGGPPGPAPRAAPAASARHALPPLSSLTPFGALAHSAGTPGRSEAPAEGHPMPVVRCRDRGRSVRRSRPCPATSSHHPREPAVLPGGSLTRLVGLPAPGAYRWREPF